MKTMKRSLAVLLTAALLLGLLTLPALAKTSSSAKADRVFFYAENRAGQSVLLKVLTLEELLSLAHGQADGQNYMVSTTDNYPTTQYCEGVGFTIMELLDYVKSQTTVDGAAALRYAGADRLYLMATDSYGSYSRSWSYDQLYGEKRYYFEGLYGAWNTGWEIAGEDASKFGLTMADYLERYGDSDPFYEEKRGVFQSGVETEAVLMTASFSGRTTADALIASTEPGIAAYVAANGGQVSGCLKDALTDACALRLILPMTEADLMAAHRTAYDNFKWIYNLKLRMADAPVLPSQGTVAEPAPEFHAEGDTLTIRFSCDTAGADIYYGFDGAPQTLYEGAVTVDISGRDLSAQPVTVYATAVREGWDDVGVLRFQYPGTAPVLETVYTAMAGQALTLTAAETVGDADWAAWTDALRFVSMKSPSGKGYEVLEKAAYTINDREKTITFDASLFTDTGSYSFIFHADRYANKSASVVMKKAAPELVARRISALGQDVTLGFDAPDYGKSLYVYLLQPDGSRSMISGAALDRSVPGQLTLKAAALEGLETGCHELELVNSSYAPAACTLTLLLGGSFSDVPADAWYFEAVTELSALGIVTGAEDGSFDPAGQLTWAQALQALENAGFGVRSPENAPDAPITRAEFCRCAADLLGMEPTSAGSPFEDTEEAGVLALYEAGIIQGVGGSRFAPEEILTRAQICRIICGMIHLEEGA